MIIFDTETTPVEVQREVGESLKMALWNSVYYVPSVEYTWKNVERSTNLGPQLQTSKRIALDQATGEIYKVPIIM